MNEISGFLSAFFAGDPDVTCPSGNTGRFGGKGVRCHGQVFAMPSKGLLAVKLTQDRVAALTVSGCGAPLVMGGRCMREWLVVNDRTAWESLVREARTAVSIAPPQPS